MKYDWSKLARNPHATFPLIVKDDSNIIVSQVTTTELDYLVGVTSRIQSQLDMKNDVTPSAPPLPIPVAVAEAYVRMDKDEEEIPVVEATIILR